MKNLKSFLLAGGLFLLALTPLFSELGIQRRTGGSGLPGPAGAPGASGGGSDSVSSSTSAVVHGDSDGSGDGNIAFKIGGSTKAVIDATGKMGVGSAIASSLLDISAGSVTVRGSGAGMRVEGLSRLTSAYSEGTFTSTSGFVGVGSSITLLNASNLALGTIPNARVDKTSITAQGPIISSVAAQSINAAALQSTDDPANGEVPKFDSATGKITWSADNNSGGGGGSAGDRITSSTIAVVAGDDDSDDIGGISFQTKGSTRMAITPGGYVSVGTDAPSTKFQVHNGSISITGTNPHLNVQAGTVTAAVFQGNGSGQPVEYSTHTGWKTRVTSEADEDFAVYETSVCINGNNCLSAVGNWLSIDVNANGSEDFGIGPSSAMINGVLASTNNHNTVGVLTNKTFDTTATGNVFISTFQWGFTHPMVFSSMSVVQTTQTLGGYGQTSFTHNDTTATNKVRYYDACPAIDPTRAATGFFWFRSSGTSSGNAHFVVSIATVDAANGDVETVTTTNPIAFTVNTSGTGARPLLTANVALTNWATYIGSSGSNKLCVVQIGRDEGVGHGLDTSNNPIQSAPFNITFGGSQ